MRVLASSSAYFDRYTGPMTLTRIDARNRALARPEFVERVVATERVRVSRRCQGRRSTFFAPLRSSKAGPMDCATTSRAADPPTEQRNSPFPDAAPAWAGIPERPRGKSRCYARRRRDGGCHATCPSRREPRGSATTSTPPWTSRSLVDRRAYGAGALAAAGAGGAGSGTDA